MGCVWHSRVHDLLLHRSALQAIMNTKSKHYPLPYRSPLWSQESREVMGWEREMHIRGQALVSCQRPSVKAADCPWDGGWAGGSSASRAVRRDRDVCGTKMKPCPLLSPHPRSKHNPTELVKSSALPLMLSPILRLFLVHNLQAYTQTLIPCSVLHPRLCFCRHVQPLTLNVSLCFF